MNHQRPSTLIVGGGIGGLTLALALHRRGLACRIVEAATRLEEVGAGINLLPHAVAVLAELGLEPALREVSMAPQELRFYNQHGQLIHAQPRGLAAGHRWPQYAIHRASLQAVLLRAVADRLGGEAVRLGARCLAAWQDATTATAHLLDSATSQPMAAESADAVVGCDGIHSSLRAQLHGTHDPLRYSGIEMWRGVARARAFMGGRCMVLAGSLRTGKIVVYPIAAPAPGQREPLINWVAERRAPAAGARPDWQAGGDSADLQWMRRDWQLDGLDVAALLARTDKVLRYPMVDKDPLPFWSQGRITLLGDAAHPMYPFGSNGACQAILDATVLADCLASAPNDVPSALKRYEQIRLPATAQVVRLNRQSSPDSLLDEVDERSGGQPFDAIDSVMPLHQREEILQRYSGLTSGCTHAPNLAAA